MKVDLRRRREDLIVYRSSLLNPFPIGSITNSLSLEILSASSKKRMFSIGARIWSTSLGERTPRSRIRVTREMKSYSLCWAESFLVESSLLMNCLK
jgi:hypothetical protein